IFSGVFEGCGHTISGLMLTGGSNLGLFRYLQEGAVVRDLKLKGTVQPDSGSDKVGALVGSSYGSVENCSFEGSVTARNYVGGLVGESYGSIRDCVSSAEVIGKRFTGGIVGYSEGLILNCENNGAVNTTVTEEMLSLDDLTAVTGDVLELLNAEDENVVSDSGGIAGYSSGVLMNCVNHGAIGYHAPFLGWRGWYAPALLGWADRVRAAGFSDADIDANEAAIAANPALVADGAPLADYQRAVESAWVEGVNLVRLIGANARYFTDSAGKVPIDVGMGVLATGIAIDFFGRFQAEYTRTPDGVAHLEYVTPKGGSCVSADPVSLLRGAPSRELGVRFIEFVLSPEGQTLWNARPGTAGGTLRYALRRLPIRRDFYPSDIPSFNATFAHYSPLMSDDLASPAVNPYALARDFTYRARWSARHFGIQRDLVRAICIDSGDELKAAWKAVIENGGPDANPEAMALILALPSTPLSVTWRSATSAYRAIPRLDYMRDWTAEMRSNYRRARSLTLNKKKASLK
ncbi:MAG: ABC transporter substrate-binding protein, partial [Kiritimatiellae bacterium]|nr:ABC transporter substrate-binding protein [Kiritimatiellia bacterium]